MHASPFPSKAKPGALPELKSSQHRGTPEQFLPVLDDAPLPPEQTKTTARHAYEADTMFTASAPSIARSLGNRDRQEQQQVLRRSRQELYSRDGTGTRIPVNMGGISSFMSYDPAL
jgi:hypothetical protein